MVAKIDDERRLEQLSQIVGPNELPGVTADGDEEGGDGALRETQYIEAFNPRTAP